MLLLHTQFHRASTCYGTSFINVVHAWKLDTIPKLQMNVHNAYQGVPYKMEDGRVNKSITIVQSKIYYFNS